MGRRVAEHFVASPHADARVIIYPEVCAWYGALIFAEVTGDKTLAAKLVERFQPLLDERESKMLPT
jgi:unsaturated rhamnogalacturonyl hydrolase